MLSAIQDEGPVIYMEHKLLADYWIDAVADGGRTNLDYDIPEAGARGEVPKTWRAHSASVRPMCCVTARI